MVSINSSFNIDLVSETSSLMRGHCIPIGWEGENKSYKIVEQLLMNNEKVSLVVYGGHVIKYGRPDITRRGQQKWDAPWLWSWRFYEFPNFSVVNASFLESIIDELFLPRCGLISENTRIIIVNMTGATHILLVDALHFNRFWYDEITTYWTLTQIESGKILAIDRFKLRLY